LRFDLSPDGKKVAFSWNKSGNWEIYELALTPVSHPQKEEKISSGAGAKFSPQYSPDGKYLSYALDLDGSESYHIILHNLLIDGFKDLTPQSGYAQQPNFSFSPDGRQLAILSDEKGQFALYLLVIENGEKTLLMDIQHPCWDVCWSPDSSWICVEAETTASDRGLFVISAEGGDPVQIKDNQQAINAQNPAWSPDSRFIAFSGENGEWHDIGLYEIESDKVTWLDQSAGDDTSPCWSFDGSRISWVHSEGAATRLAVRERNGDIHLHEAGPGVHHLPQFTKDGQSLVFMFESPAQPPDLWKLDLATHALEQLTFSMPADLRNAEFIPPEEIWYPGNDGVMVPALLYRAQASECAVINIHGGPNWQYQFSWNPDMSYMASRGWTVLAPNYRGSTGYGKRWQNASRFDMGGEDTHDCAAGAKYLVENNLADRDKIAVTGRSHGGYLTMTCMTMYSELWAGGSAVVPFLNWIDSHYAAREDLQHWNIENMGDPKENFELWYARSPYYFLDNINAPVQMICGANDPRCPASESIRARDKLVELGCTVDLVLYEDEGHTFLHIKNVIDSELRRIEFLEKALE
jgi:dipeptidyl aminopeptidase/acylaminoacyl peptidase